MSEINVAMRGLVRDASAFQAFCQQAQSTIGEYSSLPLLLLSLCQMKTRPDIRFSFCAWTIAANF
ncbi:hypothetical protein YT03_000328 [Salmonella enterica subsp. enterica]|nr:hypothetical protein [Salmonella enterica subsp. enterica serovar Sandiego]